MSDALPAAAAAHNISKDGKSRRCDPAATRDDHNDDLSSKLPESFHSERLLGRMRGQVPDTVSFNLALL